METTRRPSSAPPRDDEEFGEDEIFDTMRSHDSDERDPSSSDSEEEDVEVEVEVEDRGEAMRRLDKIASSMPHLGTSLPRPIERGKGQSGNSPTDSAHETFDPSRVGGVTAALNAGVVQVPASMPGHEPGFVPPHIYASTYSHRAGGGLMDDARMLGTGSMIDGRGHTLKGRAALKARNAFMRRTGFLEPDTPSALSQQPPDRIATPAIVVDANGAE